MLLPAAPIRAEQVAKEPDATPLSGRGFANGEIRALPRIGTRLRRLRPAIPPGTGEQVADGTADRDRRAQTGAAPTDHRRQPFPSACPARQETPWPRNRLPRLIADLRPRAPTDVTVDLQYRPDPGLPSDGPVDHMRIRTLLTGYIRDNHPDMVVVSRPSAGYASSRSGPTH